jgi:hypothetical protein
MIEAFCLVPNGKATSTRKTVVIPLMGIRKNERDAKRLWQSLCLKE